MVDAWFTALMAATTAEHRRARCARAAQQRATCPKVNLVGLGCNEAMRRRAKCLDAALVRFVASDAPMVLRGTKRKAPHDGPAVREALLKLTGGPFHLLVCGRGGKYWGRMYARIC